MSVLTNRIISRAVFLISLLYGCAPDTDAPLGGERSEPAAESGRGGIGKADGAHEQAPHGEGPAGCVFDLEDEFEPRSTFQSGPWKGACHDTRTRRPVDFLSDERAAIFQDPTGYLVVNNLYHRGAFWIAFIPERDVSHVYFQLEYFPAVVPAGHTQLRVAYQRPVILYGQSSSVKGLRDEVFDLTLSIEAVTRPGDQYDLLKGTQEHFAIAYRLTSMEARFEDMVLRQGHHVEQWRLLLEQEEADALLLHYISESAEHQLAHSYHTLFKNCTTEIIEILDGIALYSWREHVQRFLVKVTEIYPNIVRAALIARGLLPLDQSTDIEPLEEDAEFIKGYEERNPQER